jgi:hypothetical protein
MLLSGIACMCCMQDYPKFTFMVCSSKQGGSWAELGASKTGLASLQATWIPTDRRDGPSAYRLNAS